MNQHKKVDKALQQTYEQIFAGVKLLMNLTSDYQTIQNYIFNRLNEIELSEEQQIKIARYNFIYNQILGGKYSKQELISTIQNLFKVSKRQAYADFKASLQLISASAINKNFELQIQLEYARYLLHECLKANDFETALLVQKNIFAIFSMLPGEKTQNDEDFESVAIEAVFEPQLLGGPKIDMNEVLATINAKRTKKITIDMFENLPSNASCSR